jgi:hypothetical protein
MSEFSKKIKLGLAIVIFGSSCLAIHNQTIILSDMVYNLICAGLIGVGSVLFIFGVCKNPTP